MMLQWDSHEDTIELVFNDVVVLGYQRSARAR